MAKIEAKDLQVVKFRYVNWQGDEHEYVIDVESIELGPYGPVSHRNIQWQLHGHVVTRDGDPRPELGDNRRRSFLMKDIEKMEVVR